MNSIFLMVSKAEKRKKQVTEYHERYLFLNKEAQMEVSELHYEKYTYKIVA